MLCKRGFVSALSPMGDSLRPNSKATLSRDLLTGFFPLYGFVLALLRQRKTGREEKESSWLNWRLTTGVLVSVKGAASG